MEARYFLLPALLAAQYFFILSDTAWRCAAVHPRRGRPLLAFFLVPRAAPTAIARRGRPRRSSGKER